MLNTNVTIVTCYFKMTSKFSHGKYMEWMRNFFDITTPKVVFSNCVDELKTTFGVCDGSNLLFIPCDFSDFYTSQYDNVWPAHLEMDHEKRIHNINLYKIWNEKAFFVNKICELNPFGSTHFYWTDIGAFRDRQIFEREGYKNYPAGVTDQILLLNIGDFADGEIEIVQNNGLENVVNIFQYVNRVGGGIFGGRADYCIRWAEKYYETLHWFISRRIFAGKDQSVMAVTAILNPELVMIVRPIGAKYDPWFYLQEYLARC